MNSIARITPTSADNDGILTIHECRACDIADRTTERWSATGVLERLRRGLYRVAAHGRTTRQGYVAACAAAGADGGLTAETAADVLGIWPFRTTRNVVVVPRRHGRINGVKVIQSRTLLPSDLMTTDGLRHARLPRLLLDLARYREPEEVCRVMREAAFRANLKRLDGKPILEQAARHPRTRCGRTLRLAYEQHIAGSAGIRSSLELEVARLFRRHHLTSFLLNVTYRLGERRYELDFTWPDVKLNVEIDGSPHDLDEQAPRDTLQDLAARRCGWTVIRLSGRELRDDPAGCVQRVVDLLEALRSSMAVTPVD